jgi:hypothetical protein
MGIDIYATWRDQSAADRDKQVAAWLSAADGDVGYLREAYHGEPYATRVLMPEAFDLETYPEGAPIPAATLRKRLRKTLAVARARQLIVYKEPAGSEDTKMVCKSFTDFVELCEVMERATGEPCIIKSSY